MHESIVNLKARLQTLLQSRKEVLAAWEGGSAATGFLDDYSDLDLTIVTETECADQLFMALEQFFNEEYGILDKFRMPEPAWHGMSQCFYLLDKLPPLFYCDIVVVARDNPHKFTEPDRHGRAVIWFDPQGLMNPASTPTAELESLAKKVYRMATDTAFLGMIELEKALARQNWMAAQMNYITFVYRHLAPLLNLKYRPAKADFGIRYAERDYPAYAADKLADLLKVKSVAEIQAKYPLAKEWFAQLKKELKPLYS